MPKTIIIKEGEGWDDQKEEFVELWPTKEIVIEHSLVSISKWESKWHKPFLSSEKNAEEIIDYVKCMTITQNVDPIWYTRLTNDNLDEIVKYIDDPMTATWFSEDSKKTTNKEIITSEIIYCWMIQLNIPVEFQKWHLNRLMTLIRVCELKSQPPKKMSKSDLMKQNSAIMAKRRAARKAKRK